LLPDDAATSSVRSCPYSKKVNIEIYAPEST